MADVVGPNEDVMRNLDAAASSEGGADRAWLSKVQVEEEEKEESGVKAQ